MRLGSLRSQRKPIEIAPQGAKQGRVKPRAGFSQSVVHEAAQTSRLNQPACPQDCKVSRDGRLGELQQLDQVADAQLARSEQVYDPDPAPVAQRAKKRIGFEGGHAPVNGVVGYGN